ncbi:MAG: hypothetical protein F4101_02990 [Nitrospira sp. SB0673_bin_12]|nr:hypothetical protein [Nitrospira sp. SB0673_bin_12]
MTTMEQEMESLGSKFEKQEAGVADLMEFYERVEEIYIQASASIPESEVVYPSDSTNLTGLSSVPKEGDRRI